MSKELQLLHNNKDHGTAVIKEDLLLAQKHLILAQHWICNPELAPTDTTGKRRLIPNSQDTDACDIRLLHKTEQDVTANRHELLSESSEEESLENIIANQKVLVESQFNKSTQTKMLGKSDHDNVVSHHNSSSISIANSDK